MADVIAGSSPAGETHDVELTTAVKAATISGDVNAYREARRAERAGKPLADQPAAPAAAKPVDQAASTDATAQPASEAGKPKGEKLKARIPEIDADIKELNEKLRIRRELRAELDQRAAPPKQDATPASSAKVGTLAHTVQSPDIKQPMLSDVAFFAKHPDAGLGDYTQYVSRYDRAVERAESDQQAGQRQSFEAQQQRATTFSERLNAAIGADPKFMESVTPEVHGLEPISVAQARGKPITVDNAIAEEIIDSDVGPQLMRHLSANPDDLATLRATRSPRQLARAIGKLEARIEKAGESSQPKTKKVVSDAPAPGTTLGRKPAASADPLQAAVASDNFTAFRAEKQARLLAARGGR